MSTAYPHLFSPYRLGHVTLKNRIVHASMSTRYVAGGKVTDRLILYHQTRARGGAALTVTEPLNLLRRQANPQKVSVRAPENAAGLARWAGAVREAGSQLIAQIQDPGRGRHQPGRIHDAIGASALPDDLSWTVPHALTTDEVAQMVVEFAESAVHPAAGSASPASRSRPATATCSTNSCRGARTCAPTAMAASSRGACGC